MQQMDNLIRTINHRVQTQDFLETLAEIYASLDDQNKLKLVKNIGGTYNISRTSMLLETLNK